MHKIKDICTIKMANFVEASFKCLVTFERFRWIPYLTVQHPFHENLIRVFFSNATLEDVGEEDEDSCCIVAINTFVMGVPIQVTQGDVAMAFDMPNEGLNGEHVSFLPLCSSLMVMPQTSHYMKGYCTCSPLTFSDP